MDGNGSRSESRPPPPPRRDDSKGGGVSDWCSGDAVYGGGSERCDDDGGCSGGSEARCLLSKGAEVMLAIRGGSDGEGATCSFSLALDRDPETGDSLLLNGHHRLLWRT